MGNAWTGDSLKVIGDLTVDLRSNIATEVRAKMVSRRELFRNALAFAAAFTTPLRSLGALSQCGNAYYVDTAGNNRNSGTSPTQAWADFTPINSKTFQPGDRILLRRGCTWNNQCFKLDGAGLPKHFIFVGAYGTGDRPKVRQSGNRSDRCMRLNNPSYVKVSSIEVCNGGVGILLYYDRSYNNRSVYLDDIVAHNFQATGAAREEPHDRVSWAYGIGVTGVDNPANGQDRVLTDLRITNTEVYNTGAGIALDWANHHTVDSKIALRNKFGEVYMENLKLHDNTVEGISFVSLFIASVTNCTNKEFRHQQRCSICADRILGCSGHVYKRRHSGQRNDQQHAT